MIYRVRFRLGFYDGWKDFNTLFDACNYAVEIRGTKYDHSEKPEPIERIRIEFIEEEKDESPAGEKPAEPSVSEGL